MLDTLKQLARLAGDEIMQVYASDFSASSKADDSPLTEADLRADHVIRVGLSKAFPEVFVWSEESVSASKEGEAFPRAFFLVDPLDGTREFLKRNGEFTVNIAYVVDGKVDQAVVFAPALGPAGQLFYASSAAGAFSEIDGQVTALNVSHPQPDRPLRILGSRSHQTREFEDWIVQLDRPYELVSAGSSLKFCWLAQGKADLYPRFGPTCQWDTAAAQCILECAGGVVLDLEGNSLKYGLERQTLNPHFVAAGSRQLCCLVIG